MNKTACKYCGKLIGNSNLIKHERKCYMNPENLRECPICRKPVKDPKATVCSRSCSNTMFRKGKQNGNWKDSAYRSTCFLYHKKECVICGESNIVEVHHFDMNSQNHSPENLIPLCPTHHAYFHSRYKDLIYDKIVEYLRGWNQLRDVG